MVVVTKIDPIFQKILCLSYYAFVLRTSQPLFENSFILLCYFQTHGRMARGGHGIPKVLLGPTMPYYTILCGQVACGHLLPLWTPHAVRLWTNPFVYF
jgi:hypothetical protein